MEIIFHAHNAVMSERMRQRAERIVRKLGGRMRRPVDAIVRFEQDGPVRNVELVLHAPRRKPLVAKGTSRYYGPALAEAAGKLERQLRKLKPTTKSRARRQVALL